jgi:hypothetical protein
VKDADLERRLDDLNAAMAELAGHEGVAEESESASAVRSELQKRVSAQQALERTTGEAAELQGATGALHGVCCVPVSSVEWKLRLLGPWTCLPRCVDAYCASSESR